METRFLNECVEKLRGCSDSRERRAIVHRIETLFEGWTQVEDEVLFPTLRKFLGFSEWIQEANIHQNGLKNLIQSANLTQDHERILDITDEIGDRVLQYLEGIKNILFPRLIQTLKPAELDELRLRMGPHWMILERVAIPYSRPLERTG
jgi:hypothetical protein